MAKRTIVDTAALNLIINALRRDEAEGFMARGEMADIILKTATEYIDPITSTVEPSISDNGHYALQNNLFTNPLGEIALAVPTTDLPDVYYQTLLTDIGTLIADWEHEGRNGFLTRDYIIKHFKGERWPKRYIKKVLKENFEEYWQERPYHKR